MRVSSIEGCNNSRKKNQPVCRKADLQGARSDPQARCSPTMVKDTGAVIDVPLCALFEI